MAASGRRSVPFADDPVMGYKDSFDDVQFIDFLRRWWPGLDVTQHMVTNFEVRVCGDIAKVRSMMQARLSIDAHEWRTANVYHHRLRRVKARWLISEMGTQRLFRDGDDLTIRTLAANRLVATSRTKE